MKQYLLSIYQPDGEAPPPETLQKVMHEVSALIRDMKATGAWVFDAGLHPASSATVVRSQGDDVLTTDGPFTEGKEHIGGFVIVQAPDLDEALVWARKLSRALTLEGREDLGGLPIEVRPIHHG